MRHWGPSAVWAAAAAIRNKASLRVLQKGGLRFLRDNPDGYRIQGQPIATREYELTRAQWARGENSFYLDNPCKPVIYFQSCIKLLVRKGA